MYSTILLYMSIICRFLSMTSSVATNNQAITVRSVIYNTFTMSFDLFSFYFLVALIFFAPKSFENDNNNIHISYLKNDLNVFPIIGEIYVLFVLFVICLYSIVKSFDRLNETPIPKLLTYEKRSFNQRSKILYYCSCRFVFSILLMEVWHTFARQLLKYIH